MLNEYHIYIEKALYYFCLYLKTNLDFSNNPYDKFKGIKHTQDSNSYGKLVISKRVKSIRQLKNSEKELSRLCYKNAILKGLVTIQEIQYYIASKSKIWIERSGLEYLKESEEREDREWFLKLARDKMAYISVYRKCIDELELVKKQCWNMIMNPNMDNSVKIQCLREIHSLTKTMALLLRDLPYITNLSKVYDQVIVDSMFSVSGESISLLSKNLEIIKEDVIQNVSNNKSRNPIQKSGLEGLINKTNDNIIQDESLLNDKLNRNVDDSIMEEMSKQLNYSANDLDSKTYNDSVKKLKDIFE